MSSTITVSRRIGAFRSPTQILYACFESTYESNVFPHTPRESCVAFGTASSCMTWILAAMSSCCGGMLRGPSRNLTPFGYYRTWKAAFANPVAMYDRDITLDAGTHGNIQIDQFAWYERNELPDVLAILRGAGYADQADVLEARGKITVQLRRDGDVLAKLLGDVAAGGRMAPWRFIDSLQGDEFFNPEANDLAATDLERVSTETFGIYDTGIRFSDWPLVIHDLGNGLARIGSPGSILSDYLETEAVRLETESTGAGIGAAIALDKALKQPLPKLSDAARIGVDMTKWASMGERTRDEIVAYAQSLGLDPSTSRLDATLGAWRKAGILEEVGSRCYGERFTLNHPATVPAQYAGNGDLFAA